MSGAEEAFDRMKDGRGLSRRAFLSGAVGVAAMVAVGGAGAAFAGDESALRPPGGQDASLLWGACIKCDRCRSACPMNAIGVGKIESGLLNARTPVMDFRKGYCDFCEKLDARRCVEACPVDVLSGAFDPASDKIGMAVVDVDECLLYRSGSSLCSKQCIGACAYDAISWSEAQGLLVDELLCNGCGACEFACPSASYAAYTGSGRRGVNIEPWRMQHA